MRTSVLLNWSLLWALCFLPCVNLHADVKTVSGNLNFNLNNDAQHEMRLTNTGLGIGELNPSANLQVPGTISSGNIFVGSTSGNSGLSLAGTMEFNLQTVTTNTTLSGNSYILADTSAGNVTIIIPDAAVSAGRIYVIKKITNSNSLVIMGSDSMDQRNWIELTSGNAALPVLQLISNGNTWNALNLSGNTGTPNLIAWWQFNDRSGTTARDSGPYLFHGTLSGSQTFSGNSGAGILDKALIFDGVDDLVTTNDLQGKLDAVTKFTMSTWIYTNDVSTNWRGIFDKTGDVNNRTFLSTSGTTGGDDDLIFGLSDGTNGYGYTTGDYLSTGTWYHVVMVFDGSQGSSAGRLKAYIDGFQRTLTFAGGAIPAQTDSNNTSLTIGSTWKGGIDEFQFYNTALSDIQVKTLYNSYFASDNLIGWWKLDETSGTTATDSSAAGNPGQIGNDGTLGAGLTFAANSVAGVSGTAINLSPTGTITFDDLHSDLDEIPQFTIAGWISTSANSDATYRSWLVKSVDANNRIVIHSGGAVSGNDDLVLGVVSSGSTGNHYGYSTGNYISANTWYHVAMVYDGPAASNSTKLKLYIDGIERSLTFPAAISSATDSNDAVFTIGSLWYGRTDDVKIYDYPLTASQVRTLNESYRPNGGTGASANLIAWWKLDETTGTTATDSANANHPGGIGNDGTLTNFTFAANTTSGISGNALFFDGTNDNIDMGDLHSDMDGISQFTVSAWCYTMDVTTEYSSLLSKANAYTSRSVAIQLGGSAYGGVGANDILLLVANGSDFYGYSNGNYLSTNTWYHIVLVYDGGASSDAACLKLYLDGIPRTLAYSGVRPTSTPSDDAIFHVGRTFHAQYWKGGIDEVKIYDYPLSAANVLSLYNSYLPNGGAGGSGASGNSSATGNLIAWWKFDDASGTTAIDSANANHPAGIGNDGTTNGGMNFTSNTITGVSGNALVFDGVNDYLDMNDMQSDLDGIAAFTITGWIKPYGLTTNWDTVFSKSTDANNRLGISQYNNTANLFFYVGNVSDAYGYASDNKLVADKWLFFAMVFNGNGVGNTGRLQAYINGDATTLTYVGTIPAQTSSHDADASVGNYLLTNEWWHGALDEIKIYDYPLSSANVLDLYHTYLPYGSSNIVGWWKFESASGTNAVDSSNIYKPAYFGNDGTLAGGLNFSTNVTSGVSGNALVFDGSNDNVSVLREIADDFTISFWFKTNDTGTNGSTQWHGGDGLVDAETGGFTNDFGISHRGPGIITAGVGDGTDFSISSGASYNNNQWHHVVLTRNKGSGAVVLFVDGYSVASGTGGTTSLTATTNIKFGSIQTNTQYYAGLLDDVIMYDYPMSSANVQALYNSYLPAGASSNILAWWKLDDAGDTNASDSANVFHPAGISNDGTLAGGMTFSSNIITGVSGNALVFDGSNDTVTLGDANDYLDYLKTFSISAWIYSSSNTNGLDTIFGKNDNNANGLAFRKSLGRGGADDLELMIGNSGSGTSYAGYTTGDWLMHNQWYHVVGVYNSYGSANVNRMQIYINGIQPSLTFPAGTVPNVSANNQYTAAIGSSGNSSNYWNGYIDNVIVYDYALTSANVQTLYTAALPAGASSNLVGWWKMDELSGTNAMDSSNVYKPNYWGNDGTLTGGFSFSGNFLTGVSGNALSFDGNNDVVTVDREIGNDFTISFWFLTSDTGVNSSTNWYGGDGLVDANTAGTSYDFGISHRGAGIITAGTGTADTSISSSSGYNDNTWHHVAFTRKKSSGALALYLDGSSVATGTGGTASLVSASNITFGRLQTGANVFNGKMDDIRMYNYAMTSANVTSLFDTYGYQAGLVGHWKMDETSGSTADDSSQWSNDATFVANNFGAASTAGHHNTAVTINGAANEYFDLTAHLADYSGLTRGAVSLWFKTNSAPASRMPLINLGETTAANDRFVIELWSTGHIGVIIREANTNIIDIETTVTNYIDNQWHHVVFSSDGTTGTLYIDNVIPGMSPTNTSGGFFAECNNYVVMYLGREERAGGNFKFNGAIDDVRIYNRPLSAADVNALYNE